MIKTTLKTVMLLGMAVTGLAFAADSCEFCTLKYEQCLAEYKLCREMDCPSP
ncbi:TPA: hypothetical protein QEL67_003914 [Stenotrophomonas maltophilia]|nr:hypothetical protein [Stenotrophomonas maltophilia]HDS1660696.1 hypothetical protein [Stenotrophomonas maltophilia]HDS1672880.1 hypothetical protein [Stenotrophomonas maltophilia]